MEINEEVLIASMSIPWAVKGAERKKEPEAWEGFRL
jgi:hypothetical protein